MGNCMRLQPAKTWADDEDWEAPEFISSADFKSTRNDRIRNSQEIKIRISKKQFEDIISKLHQVRGFRGEEILADVLNNGVVLSSDSRRSWKPALATIPEVRE